MHLNRAYALVSSWVSPQDTKQGNATALGGWFPLFHAADMLTWMLSLLVESVCAVTKSEQNHSMKTKAIVVCIGWHCRETVQDGCGESAFCQHNQLLAHNPRSLLV